MTSRTTNGTSSRRIQPSFEKTPRNEIIPTFDLAVAAGDWTDVGEVGEALTPQQIKDGRFRIWIRGNSMEKVYPDGSLLEFKSLRCGIDPVKTGGDYYVQVENEATFKRLEKTEGNTFFFRAINRKKYPNLLNVDRGDILRMARAVGFFRPINLDE